MLVDAWHYLVAHPVQFGVALGVHLALSVAALSIAAAIAIPTGIYAAHRRGIAFAAVNVANIGRTLPSLAVLALVLP
ncbi:MAG TPA: ABC transporter permease, partial [Casimicrobiaceae bacterium]|nr:ABC transporter permease [Casimicrobiaceae bacterium]